MSLKTFLLPIAACVFTGSFADADEAANTYSPGSGAQFGFTETESEADGKKLAFTNAYGTPSTLAVGDAFKAVLNPDGTLQGYVAVTAAEVSTWQGGTEDATPAAVPAP